MAMQILIKKAGRSLDVDWDMFPENSQEYLKAYGIRQRLNDALASYSANGGGSTEKATADEMFAIAEGVLSRLYDGEIRAGRVAMPQTAEGIARQEAYKTVVDAWYRKPENKDRKLSEFGNRQALADRYFEKNRDMLIAQAEARLSAAADLEDLGL